MGLNESDLDKLEEKWQRPPIFRILDTDESKVFLAKGRRDFELATDAHQDIHKLIRSLRELLQLVS